MNALQEMVAGITVARKGLVQHLNHAGIEHWKAKVRGFLGKLTDQAGCRVRGRIGQGCPRLPP